jgi:hypothetical protein
LYNVSSLGRVWNRPLPSSGSSAPTSVAFVEANILVGRENNTQLDLVQITTETVILSSIKFAAPPPSPAHLHYAQYAYDSARNTLWIAVFGRAALFGLRYALKGQAPIKVSEKGQLPAFDKIAEYSLESVSSLVLNPASVEDAELFYATAAGFSLARVDKSACESLSSPPVAGASQATRVSPVPQMQAESPAQAPIVAKKEKGTSVTPQKPAKPAATQMQSKTSSPTVVKSELPVETKVDLANGDQEELGKLFKRVSAVSGAALTSQSEDKIANNLKQALANHLGQLNSRFDTLASTDTAGEMAGKVEKAVKSAVTSTVQAEIKKSSVFGLVSRAIDRADKQPSVYHFCCPG